MYSNRLRGILLVIILVMAINVFPGSSDVFATPTYYYPVVSEDFEVTSTFRATVTTSGNVSAIAGSPDGSMFKVRTTETGPGSYSHWQVVLDFGGILTGSDVHASVRSTGRRLGGDGRMGTVLNQYIDVSLDGVNWQSVEGNWACGVNCALGWYSDISLGTRMFRYARLRTTFHHGTYEVALDSFRVWNVAYKPVLVSVTDAQTGAAVSDVSANNKGWPAPNPLVSAVTLSCPAGGTVCNFPLSFNVSGGRFYVFDRDLSGVFGSGVDNCAVTPTGNGYSQTGYQANCQIAIPAGESRLLKWFIWVQPSDAATLNVSATWGGGQDAKGVSVGRAQIRPLVFLPGFVGTYPPEHGGEMDPLLNTYDNLLAALRRAGYELGNAGSGATLVTFGYDWRNPLGNIGRTTLRTDVEAILNPPAAQKKSYGDYTKVDLMGHSTGGLVARAFIEDSGRNNQQKVNRLVTVGTPHRGLPPAYRGWYGGQADALGLNQTQMMSVLTGFAICDDTLDLVGWMDATLGDDFYANALYNYIKLHIPSTRNFLPAADVPYAYLVNNVSPYNQTYPYGRPDNPFLEDLNTTGGDYDVSKLTQIPEVISSYSESLFPEARYRVNPPPYGGGSQVQWGYGRVLPGLTYSFGDPNLPGDGFVPAYSSNLREVSALTNAGNITARNESSILLPDGTNLNASHLSLMYDQAMIRRLLSLMTGRDLTLFESFWNKPHSEPGYLFQGWAIVTCSPVNTLVTDPLGRRAGLDQVNGQIINEIPGATVSEQGTEPQIILVPEVAGQYQVQGIGTGQGGYKVAAMRVVAGSSEPELAEAAIGIISPGQTFSFTFDAKAYVYLPLVLKNDGGSVPLMAMPEIVEPIFSSPVASPGQRMPSLFSSPMAVPESK